MPQLITCQDCRIRGDPELVRVISALLVAAAASPQVRDCSLAPVASASSSGPHRLTLCIPPTPTRSLWGAGAPGLVASLEGRSGTDLGMTRTPISRLWRRRRSDWLRAWRAVVARAAERGHLFSTRI